MASMDQDGASPFRDRGQVRMVFTAGLGFFTDAYDLFIIGTVTTILTPIWLLSTTQLMWLNSMSLLAAVAGALVFCRLADRIGRPTHAPVGGPVVGGAPPPLGFSPRL